MKIAYVEKRFGRSSHAMIAHANSIIAEYEKDGYELTLRQLYYQFVSRDLLKNSQQEYKRLGSVISDARLAGMVSWTAIVDRTRNLQRNSHWETPAQIVEQCAGQFQVDKWIGQPYRVEVWIEKDALVGIAERVCRRLDVSYFSCRGYTSQSEMWSAAMRLKEYADDAKQTPIIIHLGDHDPSGIDMSRDITDRLQIFMGGMEVQRIALNMDQVKKYNPPPNPAKITDSRADKYIRRHGPESWELDALDPKVLSGLIERSVLKYRDERKWSAAVKIEERHRKSLRRVASDMKID